MFMVKPFSMSADGRGTAGSPPASLLKPENFCRNLIEG
jgi:hypothetical protein